MGADLRVRQTNGLLKSSRLEAGKSEPGGQVPNVAQVCTDLRNVPLVSNALRSAAVGARSNVAAAGSKAVHSHVNAGRPVELVPDHGRTVAVCD